MNFNRARCREIRDALDEAVQPLGKRLGVTIRLGGATFTSGNIRFKLEVFGDANVGNPEAEDFRVYCSRYGLQVEDLNKSFAWAGKQYVLIGCKPRSSRFPLLGRSPDGKVFKFPVDIASAIRPGAQPLMLSRRQSRDREFG
jgi:hypothetical protein